MPTLRFLYQTAEGKVSLREVVDWEDDGDRFHGWDDSVGGDRTFLKIRVLRWLDGTELLLDDHENYGF